jgi:F-type H+-transporting ATPase subunit a
VSVTATLALVTFLVVETAGIRANGLGYLSTIFYWNKDLPILIRIPMFVLMTPIEIAGKFTKPFALCIRLLANMTAGHIVVLALIGLVFAFKSYLLGTAPLLAAVGIMMLELFVAFLQAFIFSLLASVFIGQMREGHH